MSNLNLTQPINLSLKQIFRNALIYMFIVLPAIIPIHEFGHYIVGTLVYHAKCSIEYYPSQILFGTAGRCFAFNNDVGPLFYFAGGLMVLTVLGLVYWLTHKQWTLDIKLYAVVILLWQGGYGLYEGIAHL